METTTAHDWDVTQTKHGGGFLSPEPPGNRYTAGCSCGWKGAQRYTEAVAYYDAGRHMGAATGQESD